MKEKHILAIVATVLIIVAALVAYQIQSASHGGNGASSQNQTDCEAKRTEAGERGSASDSAPRGKTLTIQHLVDRGFRIQAKRLGRTAAEGEVKIHAPGGAIYWGDEFRVSANEGAYLLTGNVGLQQGGGRLEAQEEQLFVRIGANGEVFCSPGEWKTTHIKPNKSE